MNSILNALKITEEEKYTLPSFKNYKIIVLKAGFYCPKDKHINENRHIYDE
jgi:hypothetical protein